jgi:putative transposase
MNQRDYQRFADGLIVFNNKANLNGRNFYDRENFRRENPLVNIVAYCIMPNHFHLLLEQRIDNGITKFLQKMTTSYTMYFNKKYKRTGALIQGVFKRSNIKSDTRLLEMSRYIHANPTKLLHRNNTTGASIKEKLLAYQWSSFPDYAGVRSEESIVANKEIITNQFRSIKAYVKYILGET